MQATDLKTFVDSEMKQIEITKEVHRALKMEAADRDVALKGLASDILEGWLDSHRPGWKCTEEEKEEVSRDAEKG